MVTEEIKNQLRAAVGKEYVLDSEIDRFGYSYDSSFVSIADKNQPEVVVRPATTEEVSAVMKIANANGIAVTPRGTSSGRTGGSIPLAGGIALSLTRLDKILELDEKNMMVWAEAGVRTIDLYNH